MQVDKAMFALYGAVYMGKATMEDALSYFDNMIDIANSNLRNILKSPTLQNVIIDKITHKLNQDMQKIMKYYSNGIYRTITNNDMVNILSGQSFSRQMRF
jgi:hypothetical protein